MGSKLPDTAEGLAQQDAEPHTDQLQSPGAPSEELLIEACPRDFSAASLESATNSVAQLFEKQAELSGMQAADTVFDAFESAFIGRLEERLTPFIDTLLPQIQETHVELKQSSTARLERRQGVFARLQQIAATVTNECKLLPPVAVVGEFVSWEPIEVKEND